MAIAMARQGGIGILHRNLSIEDQAYQVDLVKRTQTGMISNPVTIGPDATLEELDAICGEYRVSGLPGRRPDQPAARHHHQPRPALRAGGRVGQHPGRRRDDPDAADHRAGRASAARTPPRCCASTSASGCRSSTTEGRLAGLITVKDFVKSEQFPNASQGRRRPAARRRRGRLLRRGVAARHHAGRGRGRRARRRHRPRPRAAAARHGRAGSRATRPPATSRSSAATSPPATGAQALVDAGVDAVKVGVGPGLDLHDPRGRRGRRTPGHRDLRGRRSPAVPPASR